MIHWQLKTQNTVALDVAGGIAGKGSGGTSSDANEHWF